MSTPLCEKCRRRNLVTYQVEPKEALRLVLANRWKSICPSCFDAEAEHAGRPLPAHGDTSEIVERYEQGSGAARQEA